MTPTTRSFYHKPGDTSNLFEAVLELDTIKSRPVTRPDNITLLTQSQIDKIANDLSAAIKAAYEGKCNE